MDGIRSTYECQEKSLNIQAPKGPAIILVPISTHVTKLSHKAICLIPTISVPGYEPLSLKAMRKLTINRNHRKKSDSGGPETKGEPGAEKLPEGGAHPTKNQSSAVNEQNVHVGGTRSDIPQRSCNCEGTVRQEHRALHPEILQHIRVLSMVSCYDPGLKSHQRSHTSGTKTAEHIDAVSIIHGASLKW